MEKKYCVRIYFSTFVDVEVSATDRDDAIDKAHTEINGDDFDGYNRELLSNMVESDDEDVTELD